MIATPLGHLDDITLRAIDTLKKVDYIAAEDTRHSQHLLKRYEISTSLVSLHEHNEQQRTQKILDDLKKGASIALISDAGTPLISDPGARLVAAAHLQGIRVIPIPGASALVAALSAVGFSADQFIFEGFLPTKAQARQTRLETFLDETRTVVLYEAPHRITDLLTDMRDCYTPERPLAIAKEITKMFETIHVTTVGKAVSWLSADSNRKRGEFVVLLAGQAKEKMCISTSSTLYFKTFVKRIAAAPSCSIDGGDHARTTKMNYTNGHLSINRLVIKITDELHLTVFSDRLLVYAAKIASASSICSV